MQLLQTNQLYVARANSPKGFDRDRNLALLNNDMNLPPNPPFWEIELSKSLTCGGFRGRSRKVVTHRFILGFSNARNFLSL